MMWWKWVKFAWKNVWRNRRRSLVTLGITASGVAGILFFGGFALFTYESLQEFSARQQGHVIIANQHYFDQEEETPMQNGLSDWQDIRAQLTDDVKVRVVLPRIEFTGLVSNGDKSTIFVGSGVDARKEFTVTGPFFDVQAGDILPPEASETPQVMLGHELADNLNAQIGSILTILSTTSEGALNGIDVQVIGIFGTGVPELDKRKLVVHLKTAQDLIQSAKVSTLSTYLYATEQTHLVEQQIQTRLPQLATRNWSDLAFFYHKVRNLYDRIFSTVGIVIALVVLLSVINTLSMAVMERTREIGALAALGTLPRQTLVNFVIEGGIIGALGALLGVLMAGVAALFLTFSEIMMPAPPGMTSGYPLRIYFSVLFLETLG